MGQNIVIYQDEGVGEFGLKCLQKFFKNHDVWLATAEAIIDGRVLDMADIFVMPGGADLPYCKKLNGTGNQNIRSYVEGGGTYLGICAGAYYACKALEFHAGRPDEISGPRELALIDAVAYGSLPELAPYYDLTLNSATIAEITLEDGTTARSFYHGGPAFKVADGNTHILATYAALENNPAAIIATSVEEGRAVLTGVHLEVSVEDLPSYPLKEIGDDERLKALAAAMHQPSPSHNYLRQLIGIQN